MTDKLLTWYKSQIESLDPKGEIVQIDTQAALIIYCSEIPSDESRQRPITPEELVHALIICILASTEFQYPVGKLYHEKHFAHGSKGSLSDEVDILILDSDNLAFAVWELKSAKDFQSER